jgi:hypothetical protein
VDSVAALFQRGFSLREIARRTGLNFGVVRTRLIRSGLHEVHHKRIRDGVAVCRRCGREQTTDEFPALDWGQYRCRSCPVQTGREAQARRRGATEAQYQALLSKQQGRCVICGMAEGMNAG